MKNWWTGLGNAFKGALAVAFIAFVTAILTGIAPDIIKWLKKLIP